MAFKTEKQIEKQLAFQDRPLTLPDGTERIFSMTLQHWEAAEFMNRRYSNWAYLTRHATSLAQTYDVDLDQALATVINRLHTWYKAQVDARLTIEPGPCPMFSYRLPNV